MVVEADTIVVLKRLLDRHVGIQGMEGCGSHAGRQELVLASRSAQVLWAEGPVPVLYCSMRKGKG